MERTGNVLLDRVLAQADRRPRDTALIDARTGMEVSYEILVQRSAGAARWLDAAGAEPGSYVVITTRLDEVFVELAMGCFLLGAIPALLDAGQSVSAVKQCVEELEPSLWVSDLPQGAHETKVVTRPAGFDTTDEVRSVTPAVVDVLDPVLMLYTSGTTGVPKGVPWSSRELESQIRYYGDEAIQREFCFFPHLALVALALARTVVLPNLATLQPRRLDISLAHRQMCTFGCDYVFASPMFWHRMNEYLEEGTPPPPVKVAATAGSAVSASMMRALAKSMPQTRFRIPYASTEALMPITMVTAERYIDLTDEGTLRGAGVPLGESSAEMQVAIVPTSTESANFDVRRARLPTGEVGEILVQGARVTQRYFRRPDVEGHAKLRDQFTNRVWHRTADMGYVDTDGCLWFLCRKKDITTTPAGDLYPDALEQMWNSVTGTPLSAVVYSETFSKLFYVLPVRSRDVDFDRNAVMRLADKSGVRRPEIIYLDGDIPTDVRHNSKVDRQATLRKVEELAARRTANV